MADNPFEPKYYGLLGMLGAQPRSNGLLDSIGAPASPTTQPSGGLADFSMHNPPPPAPMNPFSGFGSAFDGLTFGNSHAGKSARTPASFPSTTPPSAFSFLANDYATPAPPVARHVLPPAPKPVAAQTKRKGFFSFHYADIIRVNNVRNAWKIDCPGREDKRQFYDRSLWESVQRKNPEGLKTLIQRGMEHASVVCVLVGTHTWSRPWVRYEIARSVIEKKGLLAVHINGLRHYHRLAPDANGENPLDYMSVGCPKHGTYYLYERVSRPVLQYGQTVLQWRWEKYGKFTLPVSVPKYMNAPAEGKVVPLSAVTATYDYVGERGHEHIGRWIDTAALCAGR
jgi:antiphage defense system Thoeris ThsB-like protein